MIKDKITYTIKALLSSLIICSVVAAFPQTGKAELIVSQEFPDIGWATRILPDPDPGKFWIVSNLEGLYLLSEDLPGVWSFQLFPYANVIDATGPTSNGFIYCTAETNPPDYERHIAVFNSSTYQFEDTFELPWDYSLETIVLSEDELNLYFAVDTTDAEAFHFHVAPENSGLIVEMNIATELVTRTVAIQPWPQAMYVWEDDAILASCDFSSFPSEPPDDPYEMKCLTQVVDIDTFTRISEIISGGGGPFFTNEFMAWDDSYVAQLNNWLYGDFEDPMFADGIWLIDPLTGAVDSTITIFDDIGINRGVRYACISGIRNEIMYVSAGDNYFEMIIEYPLIVTDLGGNYLDKAILPPNFIPGYIYETQDGKLLVTGVFIDEQGTTTRLYILEWVNNPPICELFVVTPMPYQGPSPAAIEFDATGSYDPDPCDELTFEWDFDGDGIFSEPVDDAYTGDPDNPTHEYTSDYDGPITLKLSDIQGAETFCTVLVNVDII